MIKLNFIPEQQRRQTVRIAGEDFGGVPGEVITGVLAAVIAVLLVVHLFMAGFAGYRLAGLKFLETRWKTMTGDKKAFDDISDELKKLQAGLNSVRPITVKQDLVWSSLLNDISDCVPKGVWLRQILFEGGYLTVFGSSVSKLRTEMVDPGNFVTALNAKPGIQKSFKGVEIDSIQRRGNEAVSIADFSLKAQRK
jgi:Tfp pilus assembly protein PilN